MIVGRLAGWMLILLAGVMASADAVMALSPADYAGIATADVVMLLTGGMPDAGGMSLFSAVENLVLQLPAWVAIGAVGTALLASCRKRSRPRRLFQH